MIKLIKTVVSISVVASMVLLSSGCTTAQKSVQVAVEKVCDLSISKRAALRSMIDETTEPHIVRIECN